jgi:hypothetical protein
MPRTTKKGQQPKGPRGLKEEKFFKQEKGEPQADEVKALMVPFVVKGKGKMSVNKTIICVSQNGDFVLLLPETLQEILAWYNGNG